MTSAAIQTTTVELTSGDWQIPAYLAEPEGTGPYPGVIVIQEVFGVNAHIRDVTERFARAGYGAIAPHIYHRQAPGFEVGYGPEDLELGRRYKNGTKAAELLSDIQAAIDHLRTLAQIKAGGMGCIGFCFGGHVTYLAATLPDIQAAACFYGAGIPSFTPGGGEPTISRTAEITGTLYGFFGTEDPLIPLTDVDQIEAALKQHGIPHQIFRYQGASHGFFCDQRDSYHPEAAADAWNQVMQLFRQKL
ncbi:Putative carboxymethylenebutenolidase [Halomicronema hongdechloris C2206]|uniref:Carboxymethylenebutenolidase n=1 Tax=Halomicronema hongdechloris C2206 TaxID=1641165 RepID=A0A1Z3HU02_9CYAN|nr:dienelactone hydrolase family protein [Halomicronema hongdechloris]ASC73790.1 Putative carboxymethylenebutenolidase [Halomicronema hongdechloris C2206]